MLKAEMVEMLVPLWQAGYGRRTDEQNRRYWTNYLMKHRKAELFALLDAATSPDPTAWRATLRSVREGFETRTWGHPGFNRSSRSN